MQPSQPHRLSVSTFVPACYDEAVRPLVFRVQICHEFERFSVYMTSVKVANFYGGIPIKNNKEQLESDPPHVVVGTPGRIKQVCIDPSQTLQGRLKVY
jgi:hypothetical protein